MSKDQVEIQPPELTELQAAYNQGIEDAKCAIRATLTGGKGDQFKPYFINQIARTCSPYRFIAAQLTEPTYDQVLQAITDIQEARESHALWAAHLRLPHTFECQGCVDHSAHIGDAVYHDEWIAKYDHTLFVLAHIPVAGPPEQLIDEVQRRMDQVVEAAVEWHQSDEDWIETSEKLGAAIESLLELRSAPVCHAPECFCGTDLVAGVCPNGHDPIRAAKQP